uniref:Transmembrane 4 L6 family member 1-like n=1 Tax=Pundamilia nyererei TaxID=303518 RepID=A0A3B4GD43_9CICH
MLMSPSCLPHSAVSAAGAGTCNQWQCHCMCGSVLAAVVGLVGSAYCFIVSGYALLQGPQCFTSYGWSYPFADQKGRYLLQPETWTRCLQPVNIIEWNITLLCVLLGLAVLEFIICLLQLGNGLVNAVCRPCCYKQEYSLNA